jgi:hypothetical protein
MTPSVSVRLARSMLTSYSTTTHSPATNFRAKIVIMCAFAPNSAVSFCALQDDDFAHFWQQPWRCERTICFDFILKDSTSKLHCFEVLIIIKMSFMLNHTKKQGGAKPRGGVGMQRPSNIDRRSFPTMRASGSGQGEAMLQ